MLPQAKQDVKDFNSYCPIKFKYCKKSKTRVQFLLTSEKLMTMIKEPSPLFFY